MLTAACFLLLSSAAAYLVPTPAPPRPQPTDLCLAVLVGTFGAYNGSGDGGAAGDALLLLPAGLSVGGDGDLFWVENVMPASPSYTSTLCAPGSNATTTCAAGDANVPGYAVRSLDASAGTVGVVAGAYKYPPAMDAGLR